MKLWDKEVINVLERTYDVPIDWRGYLKYVLPFLLFIAIIIISIGLGVTYNLS